MEFATGKEGQAMKTAVFTSLAGIALIGGSAAIPATQASAQETSASKQGSKAGSGSTKGDFVEQEYGPVVPGEFSKDEIREFFVLMAKDPAYTEIIDPEIAAMMAPGPVVEDWEKLGVDIEQEIASKRGGSSANLLHELDPEMPTFYDLSGTISFDFTGYESHVITPVPEGKASEKVFVNFMEGMWFEATASGKERRGNATCLPAQFGVTLHSAKPYALWSEDELIDLTFIYAILDALNDNESCTLYEKRGRNSYFARNFYRNGASLPVLDDEDQAAFFTIVSVSKVEKMLRDGLKAANDSN
jgi:hypothetical protein